MNLNSFVFSNRWYNRFLRHFVFWISWWVFFWLTYWFPMHHFPGWHLQGKILALAQNDMIGFWKFVITSSARGLFISMFFTYILIYLLTPLFLMKGRYLAFIAGALVTLAAIVIYQYNILLKIFQASLPLAGQHEVEAIPDKAYLLRCAWENVLFNCPTAGALSLGIKLLKSWFLKQRETQQVASAKSNAELQLLKAQVHPHFLFNTLNNIYSFTLKDSPKAPEMIKKLRGLLHYIIYECNTERVPLVKELAMLQDYMSLERIRYEEQMDMIIKVRGDASNKMIAPLLLLPFVENSFKHGTSKMLSKPWVSLNVVVEEHKLYFTLDNSKPEEYAGRNGNGGIGLKNVQKRLVLIYPGKHRLHMASEAGHFTVRIEIDLQNSSKNGSEKGSHKKHKDYELA